MFPLLPLLLLASAGGLFAHELAHQLGLTPGGHVVVPIAGAVLAMSGVALGRGLVWTWRDLVRVQLPIAVIFEVVAHSVADVAPRPTLLAGLLVVHVVVSVVIHGICSMLCRPSATRIAGFAGPSSLPSALPDRCDSRTSPDVSRQRAPPPRISVDRRSA